MFGVRLYWGLGSWRMLLSRDMESDFDDMQVLENRNALKIGGCWAIAPVSFVAQIFEPCILVAGTVKARVSRDTKVSSPASCYPILFQYHVSYLKWLPFYQPSATLSKLLAAVEMIFGQNIGHFSDPMISKCSPFFAKLLPQVMTKLPLLSASIQSPVLAESSKYSSLACSLFSSHCVRFSLEHKLSWPSKSSKN